MMKLAACGLVLVGLSAIGQALPSAPGGGAAPAAKAPAPLKLYSLGTETQADPFPAVNPKFFTADAPSATTVDSYLKAMVGFDPNRIWRVEGIQKTAVPGVSKVTAMISERGANAKVQTAVFYVLPDGKHLIAGDQITAFGAEPFAANRALLQTRADGPARGGATKDLLLVEFSDLQCPHCKDAQATMTRLEQDFPKARVVFQSFPLVNLHPYAYQAATYGVCVAQSNPTAYFAYAQAVYDTQGALLPETADATLKAAATKAGVDAGAMATCAAGASAKAAVDRQIALAMDLGVDQTPMLAINGRLVALGAVPYETLKQLIVYQAGLDGASAAAQGPGFTAPDLKAH